MSATSRKSRASGSSSGGSSLLAGLLIGLFIGVAVAVGVTIYLNRSASPFEKKQPAPPVDALNPAPLPQTGRLEVLRPAGSANSATAPAVSQRSAEASTTQFDFYKMLPESENRPAARTAPQPVAKEPAKPALPAGGWLQVGAFQNEADADNLKAKLALLGIESRIQTAEIPSKGLWHRVRIGPFSSTASLDQTRAELKSNGIDSTVIRSK